MTQRQYDLEERLLEFAVEIIQLTEALPSTRAGNHVAGQLPRSGTWPYPNHEEAQAAERRESHRWLKLVQRVPLIESPDQIAELIGECDELIRIFVAGIRTAGRPR